MDIGSRIKKRREALGMSQDELARKVGYKSRSSVNKIEIDGRGLPQRKIIDFANALDTTPAYLMGWDKEVDATISKELQISKEALYTINKYALTIDKNTGHSLMDIFNAIIENEKFTEILKSILLYIARSDNDWNDMVFHFSNDFKQANKETMQMLCHTNIVREFEALITELLASEIRTFNSIKKEADGSLYIGIKPENKYLYGIYNEEPLLNAAHERTDIDVTDEMRKHDDDIMDDENF